MQHVKSTNVAIQGLTTCTAHHSTVSWHSWPCNACCYSVFQEGKLTCLIQCNGVNSFSHLI